jgi:alkylhydroperoxidase family enzyme
MTAAIHARRRVREGARDLRRPSQSHQGDGALPAILRAASFGRLDRAVGQLPRLPPLIYLRRVDQRLPVWCVIRPCDGERRRLEKVAEVLNWRDSKLFSQAERTALEYAERITYTDRQVDDALFAELKKHFTEAQLVELTAAIALENFRSKFNPTLGVEAQGFCMVPTAGTTKAG